MVTSLKLLKYCTLRLFTLLEACNGHVGSTLFRVCTRHMFYALSNQDEHYYV